MVKSMVDRKVPIDGVGMQMHVKLDPEKGGPPDEVRMDAVCFAYTYRRLIDLCFAYTCRQFIGQGLCEHRAVREARAEGPYQ